MELIDKGFAQKIADRYSNLNLFTTNFSPIISTKRFIPRMKWLELVYALPYLVLRREILNSFKRTKNVLTSVKRIWNIFVRFEFPLSRYEYITTRSHRFSREIMKMQDARYKIQVKPVSGIPYPVSSSYVNHVKSHGFYFAYPYSQLKPSSMELAQPVVSRETTGLETEKEPAVKNYQLPVVTRLPPVVSHRPPAVCYEDQATYILTSTSDFITPLFSYYSFNPAFFLRQKTGQVKQREVPLNLQKSDAHYHPYAHLERETLLNGQRIFSQLKPSSMELAQPVSRENTRIETEKESAVTNYQLPVVTHQPPIVSHKLSAVSNKNLDTYTLTSTSDLITPLFSYYSTQKIKADMGEKTIYDSLPYFNFMNKQSHLNTSGVEKAPIYHTYPEIEHVTSTHTEVIKERVIEKEEESKPPHATPQLPSIDVNRLADQVYQMMERKIRIERERRGLYG